MKGKIMAEVLRPLLAAEQRAALDLWGTVFSVGRGYFARYFNGDPWHEPGDTLGAWLDGELVSTVHVCRRPLVWDGITLLCGGIANVATLPAYRRGGLSRRLLRMALKRMEDEQFSCSLLATGVPGHYKALGWERLPLPCPRITLLPPHGPPARFAMPSVTDDHAALYASSPRPLQMERPRPYFQNWAGKSWASSPDNRLCTLPGRGYLLAATPPPGGEPVRVLEWRARDAEAEADLFEGAANWAAETGHTQLQAFGGPQHGPAAWEVLGPVEPTINDDWMLRRIVMPEPTYRTMQSLYEQGTAAWWPADGF